MTRARGGVFVTAVLLVAGWLAPVPAGADATGKWRFEEAGTSPAFVDIAQSGSAISFAYAGESFAGSVSRRTRCPKSFAAPALPAAARRSHGSPRRILGVRPTRDEVSGR